MTFGTQVKDTHRKKRRRDERKKLKKDRGTVRRWTFYAYPSRSWTTQGFRNVSFHTTAGVASLPSEIVMMQGFKKYLVSSLN